MGEIRDVMGPLPDTFRARSSGEGQSEFEALFLEHYGRVLRLLIRLTGNRAQAEELANDVFLRLSHRPLAWLLSNHVCPWLYRTATNAGIDALRSAHRRKRHEQASANESRSGNTLEPGPLADVLRQEERLRVQRVLSAIKPAWAQLLLMRSGGSSYSELADALHVQAGSIGTLLNRAEAEFRKKYLTELAKEKRK
jgi:RNA polymerase sigma-70 factor (ECF subfamily)